MTNRTAVLEHTSEASSFVRTRWREISAAAILIALSCMLFAEGFAHLARQYVKPEYSHGPIIPIIAGVIAYAKRDYIATLDIRHQWFGPPLVVASMVLLAIGKLSTLVPIIEVAFITCGVGAVISLLGTTRTAALWPALTYFAFIIPLPNFFYVILSTKLQFISTELGVAFMRLFAVPVFVEGNIIDLGRYKLQVAEACGGLRYLFPLSTFSILIGYLYRGPIWQRLLIAASAAPLTILMNSLRIAVIGILVKHVSINVTEGFVHAFEGWVVFAICVALLIAEAKVLLYFHDPATKLLDTLHATSEAERLTAGLPRQSIEVEAGRNPITISLLIMSITLLAFTLTPERRVEIADRAPLVLFPSEIEGWTGRDSTLDPAIISELDLTDYLNRDFVDQSAPLGPDLVNFYVAYYDSQRTGESIHSPRNCIPGGGWEIESLETTSIPTAGPRGTPLSIRRVLIRKGTNRMLVYYWFQQRGRIMTTELQAKSSLLRDAITTGRTDGALVRVATVIRQDADDAADERLLRFIDSTQPILNGFIPD